MIGDWEKYQIPIFIPIYFFWNKIFDCAKPEAPAIAVLPLADRILEIHCLNAVREADLGEIALPNSSKLQLLSTLTIPLFLTAF